MPEMTPTDRRVVVQWPTGIMQIIGRATAQPPDIIPVCAEQIPVTLCKVTVRMYLYKPIAGVPGLKDFAKEQQ
jgi:hypothetical protein